MKEVRWLGDSRRVASSFPLAVRQAIGEQLMRVQYGRDPLDWKPMKSAGLGVREIRIRSGGAFRVMYLTTTAGLIYVLHVFQKKGRKTNVRDIDITRQRFKLLQRLRS